MKQEEEKVERERSRPPRPRLGQEKRWEILGGGGTVPCLLLPGLLEACSAPRGQYPGAWGPEVQGEGSRGAVGEGLTEAATAGGQGLLGLRVPAGDQRDREAVCPGVWWP